MKKNYQNLKKYSNLFLEDSIFVESSIIENFKSFELSFNITSIDELLNKWSDHIEKLENIFKYIDRNDKTVISILDNKGFSIETFKSLDELINYKYGNQHEEEIGVLKIEVSKSLNDADYQTIYSLDDFIQHIYDKKNIEQILELFNISKNKFKIMDEETYSFISKNFVFSSFNNYDALAEQFEKQKDDFKIDKLNSINENCHFLNASTVKFLPEDFYLNIVEGQHEKLINLFKKISFTLLLRVFSDISEFKENKIKFKMYGYKTINKEYEFLSLSIVPIEDYYKSYIELFSDGSNFTDKIGLARNVISIHLIDDDFSKVKGNISNSIKSNYNIYLKENVKKYIDVKNKITDTLFNLTNNFDNVIDELSKSLRSSFYTLSTIFLSLVLLKLVKGTSDEENFVIFTFEIFLFLSSVLIAMFLFKKYVLFEVNTKKKRLFDQYKQLKRQYRDILDENDLNQIFQDSNFEYKNKKYIDEQISTYSYYWNTTLGIYFVIFMIATICS